MTALTQVSIGYCGAALEDKTEKKFQHKFPEKTRLSDPESPTSPASSQSFTETFSLKLMEKKWCFEEKNRREWND